MHLRTRMVERRNAEEAVLLLLSMVVLLDFAGMHQAMVLEHDRLGEACCSRAEIDRRVVIVRQLNRRCTRRTVARKAPIRFGEGRTVVADVEARPNAWNAIDDLLHPARELGSEHEHVGIRKFQAVLDFVRRVAEIQRHRQTPRAENSEINRQPFKTVHQQNGDLVALLESSAQQQIGKAIGLFLEFSPGDFTPKGLNGTRFNQRILPPSRVPLFQFLWINLNQCHVVWPFLCVAREYFCDLHVNILSLIAHLVTSVLILRIPRARGDDGLNGLPSNCSCAPHAKVIS